MLNALIKRRVTVKKIALLLLAGVSLLSTNVAAQETNTPASKVTKIFDRELPNVPGKSMRAVLVEYGPGASSPSRDDEKLRRLSYWRCDRQRECHWDLHRRSVQRGG